VGGAASRRFHAGACVVAAIPRPSHCKITIRPSLARDDYRSIAQTIDALARSDDAVILDAPGQQEIFNYYYHGSAPVYALPRQRPASAPPPKAKLQSISASGGGVRVLWATEESDPAGVSKLAGPKHVQAGDNWYGNVGSRSMPGSGGRRGGASAGRALGTAILLRGYTLGGHRGGGECAPAHAAWQRCNRSASRYKVFAHLLDPRGFVIAQRSEPWRLARPAAGRRATR